MAPAVPSIPSYSSEPMIPAGAEPEGDEIFDVAAVEAGAWAPGPYGPGDQLGTLNEVTPEKTSAALGLLDLRRPVVSYDLSELIHENFPAFGDRRYEQVLQVTGYQPPRDFAGIVGTTEDIAPNRPTINEDRVRLSYSIGTKINGLNHVGVGGTFYGGVRASDIVQTWGTTRLGIETAGPIVTRGVLVDVVGQKFAAGETADYFLVDNRPVLVSNYRITVEDIEAALTWEGLGPGAIEPGDVILLRTGWRELIAHDPERYIGDLPPGPYLRECRYLARRRPAIIGDDVWCFGTMDRERDGGHPASCHQELAGRFGIRVAEAIRTDGLAADCVYEFVFCCNPTRALGATASNAPPLALGQPRPSQ